MSEGLAMSEEIKISLAHLEGRVEGIEGDTKRIIRLLEGNGQPGLVVKVDRTERDTAELKDSQRWLTRAVWGTVIAVVVGLVVQLIRVATQVQR